MEVPRLGAAPELQLLATATATATWDPSNVCDLHHSSWQCPIPKPLSKAMDRTHVLMDTSQILNSLSHDKISIYFFFFVFLPFLGPLPQHMEVPKLEVESEL